MRLPVAFSPLADAVSSHFAEVLTPGQQRTLTAWVAGTLVARSSCLSTVVAALVVVLGAGHSDRVRQALQEWLYNGAERSSPGRVQVSPEGCFAPLLRFVLALWRSPTLALALDATTHTDQLTALVLSVLYRGRAIPIAWHIAVGQTPGGLLEPLLVVLDRVAPVTQQLELVTVAVDRGLWSPRLADRLQQWHWHPLMRVQQRTQVWLGPRRRVAAGSLVAGPGHAWVGRARVQKDPVKQRWQTVLVVWCVGHTEPWVVLSDLPPRDVGLGWYGLRMWIEAGFRDLKALGWQWERTRRRDPTRVSRHWLVLALATTWALALGTDPGAAASPGPTAPAGRRGSLSVFRLGCFRLLGLLLGTLPSASLALLPTPWPTLDSAALSITFWTNPEPRPPVNLPL